MGLLAISSCAIGLLIAMVLVSKDSALVTSRIHAITVTDVGRFFINRVLAPNARAQTRASSHVACSALLGGCLLESQLFACSKEANRLLQTPGLCLLALGGFDPADVPSPM